MAKCGSCIARKGKRNCPALGVVICPQCCGMKRHKEIGCPPDCFFLERSKEYFTDRQEVERLSYFEREMKSIIGKEDTYADMLQNVEFMIHKIFETDGNITDRHVETALEYLLETGKAQLNLPAKVLTELTPGIQRIVDGINDILGFRESIGQKESLISRLKCIYRVLDSVRTHHDSTDDCRYLRFIGHFHR
jgi:hypothetical protein